ncbi:hypothetical protein ACFQYP_47180 [Nonomuraea antimicrobica]
MKPVHRSGPAAAAVVVCASVVLAAGACGGTPQAPSPASCPQHWGSDKFGDWVPDTSGVEGAADSLVPGSPVGALICAYPGENAQPGHFPLAGSRTLTGQATAMAHDLGYLPVTAERVDRACTLVGGKMTNYLVRFAYPDGQALWVGTAEEPNSCVTTTNGTVNTPRTSGPASPPSTARGPGGSSSGTTPAARHSAGEVRTSRWCPRVRSRFASAVRSRWRARPPPRRRGGARGAGGARPGRGAELAGRRTRREHLPRAVRCATRDVLPALRLRAGATGVGTDPARLPPLGEQRVAGGRSGGRRPRSRRPAGAAGMSAAPPEMTAYAAVR